MPKKILGVIISVLPFVYFCFTLSSVLYLGIISIFKIGDIQILRGLQFLLFLLTLRGMVFRFKYFAISLRWRDCWILLPMLLLLASRFPLYYPSYDDLVFHMMAGDYGLTVWINRHFMPMNFGTYIYPLAQMIYIPLLHTIGIRLTLLTNGLFLILWFFSLSLRFKEMFSRDRIKKVIIDLVFLYIFFNPHLMATHVSLMVDFLTLILTLEFLCGVMSQKMDKTLPVVAGVTALIIKQSSGIAVLPAMIYLVWGIRKQVKWKYIVLLVGIISVYFLAGYKNTGNPIAFLYNSVFRSSLYSLVNFKDLRWGPQNWREIFLWPVIGQFTLRFGEGLVNNVAKIFFSFFIIIPYLGSIILFLKTKQWKYFLVIVSYFIWSLIMGYSRYQIPLSAMVLIWFVLQVPTGKVDIRLNGLCFWAVILFFTGMCFSSVQTDYAWRPGLLTLRNRFNRSYFFDKYKEGLSWLGKDRVSDLATYHKNFFSQYEAIVPYFRGSVTFLAYLGQIEGLRIVDGINMDSYRRIMDDPRVGDLLKSNLESVMRVKRILVMIPEVSFGNVVDDLFLAGRFKCTSIKNEIQSPYFQVDNYFQTIVLFDCLREK